MTLPEGYRGLVAATITSGAATSEAEDPDAPAVIDLEAPTLPQGTLQAQAEFDQMVVWGHEAVVDPAADPYLRGAGEWLTVAEKVGSPFPWCVPMGIADAGPVSRSIRSRCLRPRRRSEEAPTVVGSSLFVPGSSSRVDGSVRLVCRSRFRLPGWRYGRFGETMGIGKRCRPPHGFETIGMVPHWRLFRRIGPARVQLLGGCR